MELLDFHRLRKRKYDALVESLGGRFSWWDRIKMGGTGVGGLTLVREANPNILLRFPDTTEPIKFSIEILQSGLLLGFNNTKEVKLFPAPSPSVSFQVISESISVKGLRKIEEIELHLDNDILIFQTNGWNYKEVHQYLEKISTFFSAKEK